MPWNATIIRVEEDGKQRNRWAVYQSVNGIFESEDQALAWAAQCGVINHIWANTGELME